MDRRRRTIIERSGLSWATLHQVAGLWTRSQKRRRRGCRRLFGCFFLLLLLGALLCGGLFFLLHGVAAAAEASPSQDVYLLIDNSQSMFEKSGGGSDPDLLRIDAARLFISYLGIDDSRSTHRCGVVFFGTEARVAVELTALDSPARRAAIFDQIRQPKRMGWTDHVAALALAQRQIEERDDANQPALVMLTDGKPEWNQSPAVGEIQAYQEQLRRQAGWLAGRGIPLYIILLGNDATAVDPDIAAVWTPLWQEMAATTPGGAFFRAHRADDLLSIYHDIVVKLAGATSKGKVVSGPVPPQGLRQTVPVEAGLARITFVISKSQPDLRVTVFRPDETPLTVADSRVRHAGGAREELWAVDIPAPGDWQVRASGDGRLTVWKDFHPAPATPTAAPTATPAPTATATAAAPTPAATHPPASPTPTQQPPAILAARPAIATARAIRPTPQPETPQRGAESRRIWIWWGLLLLVSGALLLGGIRWRAAHQPKVSGAIRILAGPGTENGYGVIDLDDRQQRQISIGGPEADVTLLGATGQITIRPGEVKGAEDVHSMVISGQGGARLNDQPLSPHHPLPLSDADTITLDQHRLRYENLRLRRATRENGF